ncbi:MAG: lysophospholipid acyltransferase family protein [bacterium]
MSARAAFHTVFYHCVVTFLKILLLFGSRVRLVCVGRVPEGACVMVSNHISHFDPPFLSGWLPRQIDWIAMAELFGAAWSKAAFTWLNVIPVDRHGDDRQALRQALRRLEQGRMVGVFPEGGIRDGAQSILSGADMREGAFLIAAKAACPVVPVVILGSERLYNRRNWLPWRRAKVYIGLGEPVFPTAEGGRKKLRQDVAAALVDLKNRLVGECQLTPDDLPHSPQERMREP